MHVSEHRDTDLCLHLLQNAQPCFETQPPETFAGGAVGLVERRFIDERDTKAGGDLLELTGAVQGELFALDDAWACNQKEGVIEAGLETA